MKQFDEDIENSPKVVKLLMREMPEILMLADKIREATLNACDDDPTINFEVGRAVSGNRRVRSPENRETPLPFLNKTMNGDPPKAWLYPMLAAFRANVTWDPTAGLFEWKIPVDDLLKAVAVKLVATCVNEHKSNQSKPEWVAKRSSAYEICAMHIGAHLDRLELDKLRSQAARR